MVTRPRHIVQWRRLRIAGLLALLTVGALSPVASRADSGGSSGGSYTTIGYPGSRQADLYVPATVQSHPQLWVVLHGAYQLPKTIETYGFSTLADAHGFLVVYPWGWKTVWDAGSCCYKDSTDWPDEIAYLNEVVADIQARYPEIDPAIRVAGFSNGAMMAYTWACQQPQITAVAAVAGAWTSYRGCERPPLLVHAIHGVLDPVVPYFGGYSPTTHTTFEAQSKLPTHFPSGSALTLHTMTHEGHDWPTGATQEIWDALS